MTMERVHALFVDESGTVSLAQLTELSGLTEEELRDLVECGALAPDEADAPTWTFSAQCVLAARTAYRLRESFALEDTHSLALLLRLLQRIEALEREIESLRARR
jgi:chaperone modulatory protein CbpM